MENDLWKPLPETGPGKSISEQGARGFSLLNFSFCRGHPAQEIVQKEKLTEMNK